MHWLWVPAVLATLVRAQQTITLPQHIEVDVIFPRNETYKPADVFPIALAVQNINSLRAMGEVTAYWSIMLARRGTTPTGDVLDDGYFQLPDPNDTTAEEPLILVAVTNATKWQSSKVDYNDRFLLMWFLQWTSLVKPCGTFEAGILAGTPPNRDPMFNIATNRWPGRPGQWQGEIRDVLDIPECPVVGAVVEIRPDENATKLECPVFDTLEGRQGNPCAVNVNKPMISSIASRASSSASASIARTAATAVASSTSTAGVGPARVVQTALAAACVLCGLAV